MTIILIILATLVLLVAGLISLVLILNRRAASQASLTVTVIIYPSGKSHVELSSSSGYNSVQLMKLALLYMAKIRYVQRDENPRIVEFYEQLMEEIVAPRDVPERRTLTERLLDFEDEIQKPKDALAATGTGERFTIRLIEGRTGDFIHNDLPLRGMAANLPISVLLVMNAVASRLSQREVQILQQCASALSRTMFKVKQPELSALNHAALNSLELVTNTIL